MKEKRQNYADSMKTFVVGSANRSINLGNTTTASHARTDSNLYRHRKEQTQQLLGLVMDLEKDG